MRVGKACVRGGMCPPTGSPPLTALHLAAPPTGSGRPSSSSPSPPRLWSSLASSGLLSPRSSSTTAGRRLLHLTVTRDLYTLTVARDRSRYDDPITRGLSTAGSAHGLGTAALAAAEPEALPFCALAYGET